jgi:hypothetical protein
LRRRPRPTLGCGAKERRRNKERMISRRLRWERKTSWKGPLGRPKRYKKTYIRKIVCEMKDRMPQNRVQ